MRKTSILPAAAISIVTLFSATSQLRAQQLTGRDKWADSARVLVEAGVRRGDVVQVQRANILIDRALAAYPNDPLLLHYAGYALYREGTLMMIHPGTRDRSGAMFDSAATLLELSATKLQLPETYALESAVYGQQIGINPIHAITLGPKSGAAIDHAVQLAPRDPRVWLIRGIGAVFTPTMFGGGMDKAESYLLQAVKLFDGDSPKPPLPAWGRAESYIWLGQVYFKEGKPTEAHDAFASAAKIEPDNAWARALLVSPDSASAIK